MTERMSDTDGKKPLGLRGTITGQVKQSFSHGRTKAVVVETKTRKRVLVTKPVEQAAASGLAASAPNQPQATPASTPAQTKARTSVAEKPAAEAGTPSAQVPSAAQGLEQGREPPLPAGMSQTELERRLAAVRAAKLREEEEARRRAEEQRRREEEERERLRLEAEARAREERERQEAERRAQAERAAAQQEALKQQAALQEAALQGAEASDLANTESRAERARQAPAKAAPARSARPVAARQSPAVAPAAERPRPTPAATPTPSPRKTDRERDDFEREVSQRRARDVGGRREGKLTLSAALDSDGVRQISLAAIRRKQEKARARALGLQQRQEKQVREVKLPDTITVQELANRMAERVADVIKALMKLGVMATMNQTIDADTAELVIEEFGHKVVRVSDADVEQVIDTIPDRPEDLKPRPPVVTIMGHVDHGKTSLLDRIRKTNVAASEAGGITQHIGAYQVKTESGAVITFLDTPGHAAFTSMRARGAQVTDIVVLVVAADDSVMPQTVEAIAHAKAANVPIIVAINKIDKPGANPERVRTELLQHDVVVEKLGGDVQDVEVSALTGQGINDLLEAIALQAEILELKANPNRPAQGAVIEAKLDVGRGPIATVLVQKGMLKRGDVFVVGETWGRVRALLNDRGERVDKAGPSTPVEVLGLDATPEAGDILNVVETEQQAREIATYRQNLARERRAAAGAAMSLEQLMARARSEAAQAELRVIVKADVQGSAEAIVEALRKIGNEEVRVHVLHSGVGAITDTDVALAEASKALIVGFNVRANATAREAAQRKGVEIRYYSVIYDLIDDIKQAASGLLKAEVREKIIGYAKILQVFKISGVGNVAGSLVTEGVARRAAGVRLLRDNVVIHEGTLKTLKRFKDEVKEVPAGQECGMAFERYEDIRPGDVIEIFERETVERALA